MEPIQPIGPRDRDVEPVQRLIRSGRDGGRERREQEQGEGHEHSGERAARQIDEQPPAPVTDDGNPHIDVRV